MTDNLFIEIHQRIHHELILLNEAWAHYVYLFTDPDRVEILNACAQQYFLITHNALFREVFLGISRLTDPSTQGKNQNLVLESLLKDHVIETSCTTKNQLETQINEIILLAKPIHNHRSKYIAHLDKIIALQPNSDILPNVKVKDVTNVVSKMMNVYCDYRRAVDGCNVYMKIATSSGPDALMKILEESENWKWKKAQLEKKKT